MSPLQDLFVFAEHSTMWRASAAIVAILGLVTAAWAQETPPATTAAKSSAQKLKEDPNDVQALNEYFEQAMSSAVKIMELQPEAARKQLQEISKSLGELKPSAPPAIKRVETAKVHVTRYLKEIEIQQTPLADIEQKLTANPDDTEALSHYVFKMTQSIERAIKGSPDEAAKLLEAFRAGLKKTSENAKEAATRTQAGTESRNTFRLERSIESARTQLAVIGKDAAPLDALAWVNGSPLADNDLKGKVVLLDFWAVWCGPCIRSFPHLREWNEKYGEKGLVTIGLTRYYEFDWNADAKTAVRVPGLSHEKEQEMLVKFAELHGLKYRFGLQSDESSLAKFYGVTFIPQVVVIDQQGKVRLIRVGSGDEQAAAIAELLEKLLGP